ncbi:uncharacterized protein UTRI_04810 [Ustilago trichophora]|uniref:Uncharacterized protein n=1 Tax=Ustilago trichophora TaxID=86804 RepID=A0A5C3ECL9_9BASI|nr:uncharacterized protein UTRI_04810 [Ustilago trichophora]
MSQCAPAHIEAGSSTGSSRHDPTVRRSKTVSYTSSSSTHSRPHTSTATSLHQQLALPIQLNSAARRSSNTISELRDPTVSPSKRGETLRAYSRQRRVFSGNDNGAPTSPEQPTRALSTAGSASSSMRHPHPSRKYACAAGLTEFLGPSLLFSSGADDTDSAGFSPMLTNRHLEALGDEASSSMSSTPSLTSPTSTLSRSTSLRSAGSERNTLMGGTRYLSLNGSADLPATMEALSPECGTSNWTRRARRWSNSMSRRMSITALNQTIHSTTSPYLKAGLQELRSIFDVDTLGVAVDDHDHQSDLEGASPADRRRFQPNEQDRLGLFATSAAAVSREQAVFESPETISPILSRQSSSEDRELPTQVPTSRAGISFKSQIYEAPVAHRRAQSWRKHRSLSISDLPNHSLLASASNNTNPNTEKSSSSTFSTVRDACARSQPVRMPLVAVGLAALSVSIIGVCAFETSIHPDAASLPLTAFMLAQSVFALVGIAGLALQKRWVIDLASRLIRAHVLCQVLIALAALRSLSRTAFYRDRIERQSFNGAVAAGVLASPRFLATTEHADPHTSLVGSFRDQVTYVCVFIVQAALPLAFVFWAQYTVASALSRATRHLPTSSSLNKDHHAQRQQSVPIVKVASADACDASRNERMRFNSENPCVSKASSLSTLIGVNQRSEGWLGFVITRLDVNNTASNPPPKFELDAAELTNRLQALARVETPTQRTV